MKNENEILLKMSHVYTKYRDGSNNPLKNNKEQSTQVLEDVSFYIEKGEILGLVGESGCGKSTLAKTILGFVKPQKGEIVCKTEKMQMIFQDPYGSLNPRKRIGWILEEPLRMQKKISKEERKNKVLTMLKKVGLDENFYHRYPRELSGGQRQRVSIAISLIQSADLIIADEPVSALDVTIQRQIMELMNTLQRQLGFSCLFISHDLNVIYQMCDRVMVMQNGKIIESGTVEEIFSSPQNDYTRQLLEDCTF